MLARLANRDMDFGLDISSAPGAAPTIVSRESFGLRPAIISFARGFRL